MAVTQEIIEYAKRKAPEAIYQESLYMLTSWYGVINGDPEKIAEWGKPEYFEDVAESIAARDVEELWGHVVEGGNASVYGDLNDWLEEDGMSPLSEEDLEEVSDIVDLEIDWDAPVYKAVKDFLASIK